MYLHHWSVYYFLQGGGDDSHSGFLWVSSHCSAMSNRNLASRLWIGYWWHHCHWSIPLPASFPPWFLPFYSPPLFVHPSPLLPYPPHWLTIAEGCGWTSGARPQLPTDCSSGTLLFVTAIRCHRMGTLVHHIQENQGEKHTCTNISTFKSRYVQGLFLYSFCTLTYNSIEVWATLFDCLLVCEHCLLDFKEFTLS